MKEEQSIFERIGQYIVDCVPDDSWKQAFLYVDITEQSVGMTGKYISNDGVLKSFDAEGDYNVALELLDFQQLSSENPKNRWNRLTATLTADYTLSLDYSWDQELYDEVERLSK